MGEMRNTLQRVAVLTAGPQLAPASSEPAKGETSLDCPHMHALPLLNNSGTSAGDTEDELILKAEGQRCGKVQHI